MSKITIYSTKICAYCKAEKDYLKTKGFEYDEVLVDADPSQVAVLLEKSGSLGVPFTVITDDNGHEHKVVGFDKPKLDVALGISG